MMSLQDDGVEANLPEMAGVRPGTTIVAKHEVQAQASIGSMEG